MEVKVIVLPCCVEVIKIVDAGRVTDCVIVDAGIVLVKIKVEAPRVEVIKIVDAGIVV